MEVYGPAPTEDQSGKTADVLTCGDVPACGAVPASGPRKRRRALFGRHGIGLLETILAMFILSLSIAGAVLLYGYAATSQKTQAFEEELMQVMSICSRMTQGVASQTFETKDILNSRLLKAQYTGDDTILGPAGEVILASGSVGTSDNGTGVIRTIQISNLSSSDCRSLGFWATGNGILTMTLSTEGGTLTYDWQNGPSAMPDPTQITSVCKNRENGTATITF
ncbi:hypothetical protein AD929_12265 [Gluconobacter potus]|uniref:Type 4 secretion system PilS N-terminal domain-containing protein n=1 Tax=Gluconobacter potus TaxID=2724927 RepID=A0A149QRP2_9PROT|nr:hypothetical protein [Gluconobacter potus]KXU99997.1 hypothetical protein AD929_12265 [Gluconobacter potus]